MPADISLTDYCLDPAAAAAATGPKTRALMPVHLYGRVSEMRALVAHAERHGLLVVEDACQAHGAERDGIRSGTAGTAAAFSFYPGKNLGAIGDAGALVTGDSALAEVARALREHGQRRKYEHDVVGWTARLDTIQAIALARKLPHLDDWNEQRRQIADLYADGLSEVGDLALPATGDRGQVWHLFVVHHERSDRSRRPPGRSRHRHRPPLSRTAPPLARLCAARLHRGRVPRRRARRS